MSSYDSIMALIGAGGLGLIAIGLIVGVVGSLISLADYVVRALALYSISKKREIAAPWIAWLPYANVYLTGKIVDNYEEERKGESKNWRKILLTFMIVSVILSVVAGVVSSVPTAISSIAPTMDYDTQMAMASIVSVISIVQMIGSIITTLIGLAYSICVWVCTYKIFENIVPERKVLYTILSIFVPLAGAICLFISSKKIDEEEEDEQ